MSSLKVHALLDSPSLAGAYHFTVRPGSPTIIDIEALLFPRRRVDRVGLAPLTSMFLFDSRNRRAFDDYRNARISSGELTSSLRRTSPQGTTEGSLYVPKDYLTLPVLQ